MDVQQELTKYISKALSNDLPKKREFKTNCIYWT